LPIFAVTCGTGVRAQAEQWKNEGQYLRSHALQALAIECAEAFAEMLHARSLASVFWLTLASLVVPVEARLGYDAKGAGAREVPFTEQVHDAAYAAWGFATQLAQTCDTNPSLCAAGQNLMSTVTDTGASLLREAQSRLSPAEKPRILAAATHAQPHKKFQARIE
jgi:hypothetical protein